MKKILILLIISVFILTNCKTDEEKCIKKISEYHEEFSRFLTYKYDDYTYTIHQPSMLDVKLICPDLYENEVLPIKTLWDSIAMIPIQKTDIDGLSGNQLKYKLKIKQIEQTKVKVKKSDNVNVSNDEYNIQTEILDSLNL